MTIRSAGVVPNSPAVALTCFSSKTFNQASGLCAAAQHQCSFSRNSSATWITSPLVKESKTKWGRGLFTVRLSLVRGGPNANCGLALCCAKQGPSCGAWFLPSTSIRGDTRSGAVPRLSPWPARPITIKVDQKPNTCQGSLAEL
jgi:hypothetical protein